MRILNLTQHPATAEQRAEGVFDLVNEERQALAECLTFDESPTKAEMVKRARTIVSLVVMVRPDDGVMIGGAPFFMSTLEEELKAARIPFAYAFSKRVSEERTLADGTVEKVNRFAHAGWVVP